MAFLSRGFMSRHVPASKTFLADATARFTSSISPDAICPIRTQGASGTCAPIKVKITKSAIKIQKKILEFVRARHFKKI